MLLQKSLHLVLAFVLVIGLATITYESASAGSSPPKQAALANQPIHTATAKPTREVFGFALASSLGDSTFGYPSWDFSLLGTVAFFGLHINWDGTIVGDSGWNVWNSSALSGLMSAARAHGTKVVLTIVLQDFQSGTPNMCAGLINRAITVKQTVGQVAAKGVDGVNLDYEGLNGTCQNGQTAQAMMTDFAHQMRTALPAGAYLSVDTYASSASDPYGFFDVAGLNAYVDSFFVMAYDLEYSNYHRPPPSCSSFCLGPTAPLGGYYYNDASTAGDYIAAVPASKVILGVPYYGRKACVSSAVPNAYPTSSVIADTYLDASGESGAPEVQAGSYAAHRDANDPAGKERWDTWYNTSLGCIRELYWDDTVSLGAKYDIVNQDGLRGVGIWNLNYGGGAPELWASLANHFAICSAVNLSVSPSSPAALGTAVTVSASASGCPHASPLYQFWMLAPGATSWTLAQPYSTSSTFKLNAAAKSAGTYGLSVWVRDASSTGAYGNSSGRWDVYNSTQYTLTSTPCSSVSISSTPASSITVGTAVNLTAHASGCPNPLYHFWWLPPGATSWQPVGAYSTNGTFSWDTSRVSGGGYGFSVWVRDASSGGTYGNSSGRWDASNGTQFTLNAPCSSVSVTSSPLHAAPTGTAVSLTANAAGCASPLYQFWLLAPGATGWQQAQAFSTTSTLAWNTSGKAAGTYGVSVWARDANSAGASGNSSGRWDAYNSSQYTLSSSACSAASVALSPAASATAGTTVTITASASGCPSPLYQFWTLAPGATSWQLAQAYSTSATFAWSTAGIAAGTYRVSVWVRDSSSAGTSGNSAGRWDAYTSSQYALIAPCSAVTVTSSPPSSTTAGAAVTFTASASGCSSPVYQFWILAPGATSWQLAQAYSTSPTLAWSTAGKTAGTYQISVWVRDSNSAGTSGNSSGRWDAYNSSHYTLK